MKANYVNLYVLMDGTLEVGNPSADVGEAIRKAYKVECQSFVTIMCVIETGQITTVAFARR